MLDQEPITKISFDAPEASMSGNSQATQLPPATTFPNDMGDSFVVGVDIGVIGTFLNR